MKQRVELCNNCKELTTQKEDNRNWFCEKCNKFVSSDSTILGNFLSKELKEKLREKTKK